jgi:hypothetical protein
METREVARPRLRSDILSQALLKNETRYLTYTTILLVTQSAASEMLNTKTQYRAIILPYFQVLAVSKFESTNRNAKIGTIPIRTAKHVS